MKSNYIVSNAIKRKGFSPSREVHVRFFLSKAPGWIIDGANTDCLFFSPKGRSVRSSLPPPTASSKTLPKANDGPEVKRSSRIKDQIEKETKAKAKFEKEEAKAKLLAGPRRTSPRLSGKRKREEPPEEEFGPSEEVVAKVSVLLLLVGSPAHISSQTTAEEAPCRQKDGHLRSL